MSFFCCPLNLVPVERALFAAPETGPGEEFTYLIAICNKMDGSGGHYAK